jgi:hypothetical protein
MKFVDPKAHIYIAQGRTINTLPRTLILRVLKNVLLCVVYTVTRFSKTHEIEIRVFISPNNELIGSIIIQFFSCYMIS